jgi:hypothetical protein
MVNREGEIEKMGEETQRPMVGPNEADNRNEHAVQRDEHEIGDVRFGLDLLADGAWKVMLGLEVLLDYPNIFGEIGDELQRTEYWIQHLNEELDRLYDALPAALSQE